MKCKLLLIWVCSLFPFALGAQTVDEVLRNVTTSLSTGQTAQAVTSFKQAIGLNADKAEMYYWTQVDKNSDECPLLAQELAVFYKKDRSYDKAFLFYKELLQQSPNNVNYLLGYADTELCRGKEDDALRTYEKILKQDANNLTANIFVGNYYYLKAEQEKKQLEQDYKRIQAPTRMQSARYKDNLKTLLANDYQKAKGYLLIVVQQFPSTEAGKTLDKIRLMEKEMNR